MNSQGYSKDNIHKGNTKIVAGGIDVDGLVRVGDQSIAGDGYVLPAVKGTEGQVLTMNADKTTSFQDASSGSLTLIGSGNNDSVGASGGTANQGFLPSFTGVRLTDIKNLPIGSSYIIEAQSVVSFTYDGTSPTVISYLQTNLNLTLGGTSTNTATISNQANTNVYPSPIVVGNTYRSYWYYKAVITRTAFLLFSLNTFSTMNRFGNTNYLVNMSTIPNPPNVLVIDGDVNDTTLDFTFQFDNFLGSGTLVVYDNPSINWYISQLGQVSGGGSGGVSDHLLLTNLNGGPLLDGGHTNMFVISGAKPMLGNINMNNNNITNTSIISGNNGDLDFTGTETHLNSNNDLHLEASSNFNTEVRIQGNGQFKVLHGGGDRFSVANNLITANRAISMDNNDIGDIRSLSNVSAGAFIDFGFLVPNQLQLLSSDIVLRDTGSGNAIEINSSRVLIDGQVGNTEIRAIGADVELTCNNLNLQGASSINNDKIAMNNTLAEHPIIVYLPALLADFPDPVKNLLVTINSSGNIRPIAYGDPDNTGVVGTTHEIVTADGLVPVQVGGICSFTPAPTVVINAGTQFEKTNTGVPTIFGCIQPSNGVGTCGVTLTAGTGATDGSVKVLGLWQ
jgi:hypothetical protein